MASNTLTDLPPELLDRVVEFTNSAESVARLGFVNKTLHAFVEDHAWKTFVASRFPSLGTSDEASYKDAARRLTTLSKAWDRRALVARYIEPQGRILSLPQGQILERWRKPRGQTLGFTPQLDCFEAGSHSILGYSAGAGICIRRTSHRSASRQDATWMVYRPNGAVEGKDDITSFHLLRPHHHGPATDEALQVVTGSANGDLSLLELNDSGECGIPKSTFITQGQPVRSSSILQRKDSALLLAAVTGDCCIQLYSAEPHLSQIFPDSTVDTNTLANGDRSARIWSTQFLSKQLLAAGLGPCSEPLHVYNITPSGLDSKAYRKFSLQNDDVVNAACGKEITSSIYPIVPLAPESHVMAGNDAGQVFLSGAYDGIIRLHDLRSDKHVEQQYQDESDDSAIYSLLPRGRETVAAGTSRHSRLKIFDLRLGAKVYSYMDASGSEPGEKDPAADCGIFLRPNSATYPGRGGGNNWARRSAESSVYSLTSASATSPFMYAGLENTVLEMAFTSVTDPHPDVAFAGQAGSAHGFFAKGSIDLSMHYMGAAQTLLMKQRSVTDTIRFYSARQDMEILAGLDERWAIAS